MVPNNWYQVLEECLKLEYSSVSEEIYDVYYDM